MQLTFFYLAKAYCFVVCVRLPRWKIYHALTMISRKVISIIAMIVDLYCCSCDVDIIWADIPDLIVTLKSKQDCSGNCFSWFVSV